MRHAIVRRADGAIFNVIDWDGVSKWAPPPDHDALRDDTGEARPGGRWDGTRFLPPPPAPRDEAAEIDNATTDRGHLLAALTMRAWPDSTPAERAWAAGVIAQAGARIREAGVRRPRAAGRAAGTVAPG